MSSVSQNVEKDRNLLPIYITTAGANHLQEPRNRPNGAVFHHILFIEDGEGMFETAGGQRILGKNTAIFVRKDYPIRYHAHSDCFKTAWVTFDGKSVDDLLEYFGADDFSVCEESSLYPQLLSCVKLYKRIASSELLSKSVYELVVLYFTELNASLCPKPIIKAKKFVEENFWRDLSVAEIAKAAGVSQSLLFRLFKENENRSPVEMIRDVRIQNAKRLLLLNPKYKISEIAELNGFTDSAYFCKVFKSETGMSPNVFRDTYEI